ncbi:MAG: penicillin-binding protein 1A [Caulobacteraceae bacterium]|nr:penicillin-binding protein 1A [Caulobacteraceae bacterium]
MANGSTPGGGKPRRTPLQALFYWGAVLTVWALIFLVAVLAVFAWDLPDTTKALDVKRQPSISYLDRSGALLAVRGSQFAPPVKIDELPPYVPAAFVAVEDKRFYYHFGFDPIGISRAMVSNLRRESGPLAGGSTITQQLARNLFLNFRQTWRRKGQELLLSVWLETKYSKKEILALYLNRVNFGGGAYGIEAAAQRYFNKPASRLTVGETALLVGLMKSPSRYSPVYNTERAERRATIVLDQMVANGAITAAQRDEALKQPVRVSRNVANQNAGYFVDWVDEQVRAMVGQPEADLIVETTLDLPIQVGAENAVRTIVARDSASKGVRQASLVALDGEGRVRAYLGGADYGDSQFDRAADAQRQAGSAFKPFVYLTAMENGHTPSEMVVDEPVTINGWSPRNYTGRFLGPMTLQTALAQSINTVAARLADQVGTTNVAATARRLGITSKIQTDPSMALGAVEVSPLQMAQAYAPFANGGVLARGYGIERVRTADGKVLYDHAVQKEPRPQVINQPALGYMIQMMRQVLVSGSGGRARVPGYDLAGKTGTTSDYRDAWFVGYTGGFVAAVWTGKDDNTPMRSVTGGSSPAEIWRLFMAAALPRLKVQAIPGGDVAAPPPTDAIGDILNQAAGGDSEQPAADGGTAPPSPQPAAPPAGGAAAQQIPY